MQQGMAAAQGDDLTTRDGKTIVQLPEGLAIREYRHSDAKSLSHHGNTRQVWDNLRNGMPHPYTEAAAEQWISHCQDASTHVRCGKWTPEAGSQGPLTATKHTITVNDEAVGSIGLEFRGDIYFRTAELGYWLGPEHWGKGILSKLAPLYIQWAWDTFDILVRINGETAEGNEASAKVLQKSGFKYEGRRPDMCCKNGIVRAEIMWGALRPQ